MGAKTQMILDEEIKSFLMDNAEDMQKVLIQEIRDKFVEDNCYIDSICPECRVDDFVHVEGCSFVLSEVSD